MKKFIQILFILINVLNVQAQVNLSSNLTACLPLNGNAFDYSGSGNNGTIVGATSTTDRFGNPAGAYAFGANKYISINTFSALAPTNEITISMWAKTSINTSNCLFVLGPDNYNDRCVGCAAYANAGSTMMLWDYGGLYSGGRSVTAGIAIDHTNWHHYVYVMSQSANIKLIYRDGAVVTNSVYAQTCINKNLPFQIGGGYDQNNGSLFFYGSIDDVTIYNRALNPAEVNTLYSGSAKTCIVTGIDELKKYEKVMVYPTLSFDGKFNIINADNEDQLIEVYSIDGKLIKSSVVKDLNGIIDINTGANGIYLLKASGKEGTFMQKIIKN